MDYKVLTQDDLLEIFPFGKSKLGQLLRSGVLPVVKVGRDYLINGTRDVKFSTDWGMGVALKGLHGV